MLVLFGQRQGLAISNRMQLIFSTCLAKNRLMLFCLFIMLDLRLSVVAATDTRWMLPYRR